MTKAEKRPFCVSIAGFDPSAGAGLLADIKTFESLKVYGFGVNTANTIQHESLVKNVYWLPIETIIEQLDILLQKYELQYFKIGILPSADYLFKITTFINQNNSNSFIIWDPILYSSSGYEIFKVNSNLEKALVNIDLITPNLPEFQVLKPKILNTNVYLKGGHNESKKGEDILILKNEQISIHPQLLNVSPKHGSGCILSASILSFLALENSLVDACKLAKYHTEKVLASNESLLAYHFR